MIASAPIEEKMENNFEANKVETKEDDILILVIGPSESGKTSFIRSFGATAEPVYIPDTQSSETTTGHFKIHKLSLSLKNSQVILINTCTPGIDQTDTPTPFSPLPLLLEKWIASKYCKHKRLSGVIYIHHIDATSTLKKMHVQRTLSLFQSLCSPGYLRDGKLALVTNGWDEVPTKEQVERERKLIGGGGEWKVLVNGGARYSRLETVKEGEEGKKAAEEILKDLVMRKIEESKVEGGVERKDVAELVRVFEYFSKEGRRVNEAVGENEDAEIISPIPSRGIIEHPALSPPPMPPRPLSLIEAISVPEISPPTITIPLCTPESSFPLYDAVSTGQTRKVRRVLTSNPLLQIDQKSPCGSTALMLAVCQNNYSIVSHLLSRGANPVGVKDNHGTTALHLAAFLGYPRITKLLLRHIKDKDDINVRNEAESTPLHLACLYNREKVVRVLLDKGADLKLMNGMGRRALFHAVIKDNWEVVRILVKAGADIEGELKGFKGKREQEMRRRFEREGCLV